jgi:hypothetical protein
MAEKFKNLASTTLNGDIDDTTTSVVVNSAMGFSGGDFRILIESEIMKVTGVSGTTLTVARHQEGTSAAAHLSGTDVKHILTVGALDARDQNDLAAYDAYASRPAAGTPGRIFLPNDGLFLERDNGSTWEKFGPIWPMTPPAAADFGTWVNQGSATIADNKGAIFLSSGPATSGENLRCAVKAYPGASFTVDMALLFNAWGNGNTYGCCGLCIRESTGGKIVTFGVGGGSSSLEIRAVNYNSATSVSGEATGWPSSRHCYDSPLMFLRYYDDLTTNRVFSASHDGINWTQLLSIARTNWMTPNQIGVFVNGIAGYSASNGQVDTGMTVLNWRQY